jgi:hypothetical protein
MRITPVANAFHSDARKREHHNTSHFQALLEAEFRKVNRAA